MHSEIKINEVKNIITKVRLEREGSLITTLSIEAKLQPADIARLLNMQKQGAPIIVIIGSEQLMFDLDISPSKLQIYNAKEEVKDDHR